MRRSIPIDATYQGHRGHDDELPDLSPEWLESMSHLRQAHASALATPRPPTPTDRVTIAALRDDLELAEEIHAAGDDLSNLNNIASPVQSVRDVFDLMPTATEDDWATVARRLRAVPDRPGRLHRVAAAGGPRGDVRAERQVRPRHQPVCQEHRPRRLLRHVRGSANGSLPASLRADLDAAAEAAGTAYAELGEFLRDELLPQAPPADRRRARRATRCSRARSSARAVDLDETYAWGQEELARITADMQRDRRADPARRDACARRWRHLDADPARKLHGTDALQAWMQDKSDAAVEALAGTHFDIPDAIRRARLPDRADPDRRHLLHPAQRGLHPAGADVVVGARGRHRVLHLAAS